MSLAGSPLCRYNAVYNAVEIGVPDTLENGPYDARIFDVPDTLGIAPSLLRFSYGFLASRIRCQDFGRPGTLENPPKFAVEIGVADTLGIPPKIPGNFRARVARILRPPIRSSYNRIRPEISA